MSKTYYLTAAIPYVNAKPHLGHVLEWFQADTIARWQKQLGYDVAFTCGTDENSLKNVQAAQKAGKDIQSWLDEYASIFKKAFADFDISITHFGRGSDTIHHWPGVQELWRRCQSSNDIYTKEYEGLYCVGCETYYTPDELVDGLCPEHKTKPELIKETNYFFKLSKYQKEIERLLSSDEVRIVDDQYKAEMLGFIRTGLEDFSVSRSITRAKGVGVTVPGDDTQRMYVWFDALSIYLTAIGWNHDMDTFSRYWPAATHLIGKGIARFHAVYWIGMLLSAGLPLPKSIFIHGYITANGEKMSKSLGNSIDPYDLVDSYGLEPVRFYLLRAIPSNKDGDFSHDRFRDIYTAELANGLGNLCSRVAKMASTAGSFPAEEPSVPAQFLQAMDALQLDQALNYALAIGSSLDTWLAEKKPWQAEGEEQKALLSEAVSQIRSMLWLLQPFLPTTATALYQHFAQTSIGPLQPVFPRL